MTANNQIIAEPLLRPKACPRCDYSLLGLPVAGTCPECGRTYDEQCVFLYGEAAGTRRRPWSAGPSTARQLWLQGIFVGGFSAFLLWMNRRSTGNWVDLMYVPYLLVPFAFVLWRSFSDQGSGVIQVKLSPHGVSQGVRGVGPIPYERADRRKLVPWRKVGHVEFMPFRGGRIHLRMISDNHFWQITREYVNAYVACTPAELDALRTRIAGWRNESII